MLNFSLPGLAFCKRKEAEDRSWREEGELFLSDNKRETTMRGARSRSVHSRHRSCSLLTRVEGIVSVSEQTAPGCRKQD